MKPTREILREFQLGRATELTKFWIDQPVTIVVGSLRGRAGTILHLVSIKPTVRYLVELGDEEHADIDQAALRPWFFLKSVGFLWKTVLLNKKALVLRSCL